MKKTHLKYLFLLLNLTLILLCIGCWVHTLKQPPKTSSMLPTQKSGCLTIVDIKDAHNPKILGTLHFPAAISDTSRIAISDGYAFVASRSGLHIIDISVPTQPVLIKDIPIQDEAVQVQVEGDYVYVATNRGLSIVDVAMIKNPKIVLRNGPRDYQNMPILDFRIQDGYMYVIDSYDYLHALNLSDSVDPKLSKSATIPYHQGILLLRASGAEVEPVFVPTFYLSLGFRDMLKNPANIVGMRRQHDRFRMVRGSNQYLCWYARFHPEGRSLMVRSLNIAPQHSPPQHIPLKLNYLKYFYLSGKEKIPDFGPVADVTIRGLDVYLVSTDNTLHKVDSDRSRFVRMTDFQISGDYVYATANHRIFFIIDIFQANSYNIVSAIDPLPQSPIALSISGDYAYLLGREISSEFKNDKI